MTPEQNLERFELAGEENGGCVGKHVRQKELREARLAISNECSIVLSEN